MRRAISGSVACREVSVESSVAMHDDRTRAHGERPVLSTADPQEQLGAHVLLSPAGAFDTLGCAGGALSGGRARRAGVRDTCPLRGRRVDRSGGAIYAYRTSLGGDATDP